VVFPARVRSGLTSVIDQSSGLHHARGLLMSSVSCPDRGAVVAQAPFAGLLVDDQHPLVRVRDVDEQRVVTLRHSKVANGEVGVGCCSAVPEFRAGTPDRVMRIVTESGHRRRRCGLRAFHAWRGVLIVIVWPPIRAVAVAGGLARRLLLGKHVRKSKKCCTNRGKRLSWQTNS